MDERRGKLRCLLLVNRISPSRKEDIKVSPKKSTKLPNSSIFAVMAIAFITLITSKCFRKS